MHRNKQSCEEVSGCFTLLAAFSCRKRPDPFWTRQRRDVVCSQSVSPVTALFSPYANDI